MKGSQADRHGQGVGPTWIRDPGVATGRQQKRGQPLAGRFIFGRPTGKTIWGGRPNDSSWPRASFQAQHGFDQRQGLHSSPRREGRNARWGGTFIWIERPCDGQCPTRVQRGIQFGFFKLPATGKRISGRQQAQQTRQWRAGVRCDGGQKRGRKRNDRHFSSMPQDMTKVSPKRMCSSHLLCSSTTERSEREFDRIEPATWPVKKTSVTGKFPCRNSPCICCSGTHCPSRLGWSKIQHDNPAAPSQCFYHLGKPVFVKQSCPYPVPDATLEALLLESVRRFARFPSSSREEVPEEDWLSPFESAIAHATTLRTTGNPVDWLTWAAVWLHGHGNALPQSMGLSLAVAFAWENGIPGKNTPPSSVEDVEDPGEQIDPGSDWRHALHHAPPQGKHRAGTLRHISPIERLEHALLDGVFGDGAALSPEQRRAWAISSMQSERVSVFQRLVPDPREARLALMSAKPYRETNSWMWNWHFGSSVEESPVAPENEPEFHWQKWMDIDYSYATLSALFRSADLKGWTPAVENALATSWLRRPWDHRLFGKLIKLSDPLAPRYSWEHRLDHFIGLGPAYVPWPLFLDKKPWLLEHIRSHFNALSCDEQSQVVDVWVGHQYMQLATPGDFFDGLALQTWAKNGQLKKTKQCLSPLPTRWHQGAGQWIPFYLHMVWRVLGHPSKIDLALLGRCAAEQSAADRNPSEELKGVPKKTWEWLLAVASVPSFALNCLNLPGPTESHSLVKALQCGMRHWNLSMAKFSQEGLEEAKSHSLARCSFRQAVHRLFSAANGDSSWVLDSPTESALMACQVDLAH